MGLNEPLKVESVYSLHMLQIGVITDSTMYTKVSLFLSLVCDDRGERKMSKQLGGREEDTRAVLAVFEPHIGHKVGLFSK